MQCIVLISTQSIVAMRKKKIIIQWQLPLWFARRLKKKKQPEVTEGEEVFEFWISQRIKEGTEVA